jgi:hypothetical protein
MNRRVFQNGIALMWLWLPLTALPYWRAWDQLPASMATHFDAANRPNGWMSRETALWYGLGLTAFVLIIFTIVLYVAHRKREVTKFSWALLAFFYLTTGLMYGVNRGLVEYNLSGRPVNATPLIVGVTVGIVLLAAVYLATGRGSALPSGDAIVEEVHAGRVWALVFVPPLVLEFWIVTVVPLRAVRFGVALVGLALLGAAALAWSGFRYCFTRHGLEIRTLGFRLRSIPASQIKDYTVAPWSPLRGYGIRGIGSCRAYVWGNKGVRIKTSDGEIFLGHREPERIVRDLDLMMSFSHS